MTTRGTTLVELLVVLIVVAGLAAVLISNNSNLVPMREDEAGLDDLGGNNGPFDDRNFALTWATLNACRDATNGTSARGQLNSGYLGDMRNAPNHGMPSTIADLLRKPAGMKNFDPVRGVGWRGPYVKTISAVYENIPGVIDHGHGFRFGEVNYGVSGSPGVLDAWRRPIVLQVPDPDGDDHFTAADWKHARFVSAGRNGQLQTPRTDDDLTGAQEALIPTHFPSLASCGDDIVLYIRVTDDRE